MTERSFFLDQHGCAKNQVDGELLIGILESRGWKKTDVPEDAALILINSCGFIESAKQESLEAVITARAAYPGAKILLAGCLAERYAGYFLDSLPEADAFFGNGDLSRLMETVDPLFASPGANADGPANADGVAGDSRAPIRPAVVPPQKGVCSGDRPELLSFPRSAYVKITEGCDNCCSFCAIPLIRGNLRSRPIADIVAEIISLAASGIFEINLIGQDLAAYGFGEGDSVVASGSPAAGARDAFAGADESVARDIASPLSRLLAAISGIQGNFRIRLLYIHPDHFPRDILPVMTSDARFLPYFDIPFQSGDEAILKAMNRKGSASAYKALLEDIRAAFSKAASPYGIVAFRTTFLVGFPGESDESFETTARFSADIKSMWTGAFTWSCEDGTPAATLKKRVPKKTAARRVDTLKELQIRITPEVLRFFVGKTVEVLVEEIIQESADAANADAANVPDSRLALGRAWFQAPEVDGSVVLQFEDGQTDVDGKAIAPGSVVNAVIMAVNGVDVEAVVR